MKYTTGNRKGYTREYVPEVLHPIYEDGVIVAYAKTKLAATVIAAKLNFADDPA